MRISDWSSDVCSSDLLAIDRLARFAEQPGRQCRDARPRRGGGARTRLCRRPPRLVAPPQEQRDDRARHHLPPRRGSQRDQPVLFRAARSEEHTSELQSLMRISYAVFCLKKKKNNTTTK